MEPIAKRHALIDFTWAPFCDGPALEGSEVAISTSTKREKFIAISSVLVLHGATSTLYNFPSINIEEIIVDSLNT
jgi:hypothetical protein